MRQTIDLSLEVKQLEDRQFEGHASTFGNVDLSGDIVMPGAFQHSLAEHRGRGVLPQMFWMHDPSQVPGIWLDMAEDARGLKVKGELVDTSLGNEMRTLLNMKAVRGLSIGFQTAEADFDSDGNRRLNEVDLWEVSLVSLAMNPLAEVESVKARLSADGEYVPTELQFEKWLHSHGRCNKSVAHNLTARIYPAVPGVVDSEARELKQVMKRLTRSMAAAC